MWVSSSLTSIGARTVTCKYDPPALGRDRRIVAADLLLIAKVGCAVNALEGVLQNVLGDFDTERFAVGA